MKKIIIIIFSIILIFALIILGINELSKYHTYTVTITDINSNNIIVEDYSNPIPYDLIGESGEKFYRT